MALAWTMTVLVVAWILMQVFSATPASREETESPP
jgi:hypothetical protein